MSVKDTVEELLSQMFVEELSNSTATNVIKTAEKWVKHNQASLEELINDISKENNVTSQSSPDTSYISIQIYNLQNVNDSEFVQLFKMKRDTYASLQNEINPSEMYDTNLLLSLWVLGSDKSFPQIAAQFKIKLTLLFEICKKYFEKIVDLSGKYVQWPNDSEILEIEKGFQTDYGFPGIAGVIGSLHITIYIPENHPDASKYYNKNTNNHTIVLQAVCDNNLLFRDIFAGFPGSNTVENILKLSPLYNRLTKENGFLTENKKHLLGGTEHPQLTTLLTPYSKRKKLSDRELKFNSMHRSVMGTVEKTFRTLENRFQRMKCLDSVGPKFATLAAGAMCTLHNFTILRNDPGC